MNYLLAKEKIAQFLLEDIGTNDLSTTTLFSPSENSDGQFLVKQNGILCGLTIAQIVYDLLGGNVTFKQLKQDGDKVTKGEIIAVATGNVQTMLSGERVILNLMQRMSGIASATQQAVIALSDQHIRITDTRKTMPGLRLFDKYAVTVGGGFNHRFGLYDGVMLKDNHIAYAGGITNAVKQVKAKLGHMVKIEVEVETLDQTKEAVAAGADIIMFDNRTPDQIHSFRQHVPAHIITEASGNINLSNIHTYQGCGVDYISLGSLTHSVSALDISFNSLRSIK